MARYRDVVGVEEDDGFGTASGDAVEVPDEAVVLWGACGWAQWLPVCKSPVQLSWQWSEGVNSWQVEFPERVGALRRFLRAISPRWNVTLFHYRNTGNRSSQVSVEQNGAVRSP